MIIKLYRTESENIKVYKTLLNEQSFECLLKNETDVINPSILIECEETIIKNINYCYIEELNRYYYITNISIAQNNIWLLSLKVDVLMTYKEYFKNSNYIIERKEKSETNNFLYDDRKKTLAYEQTITTKFPITPFNKNMQFILTTVGGI